MPDTQGAANPRHCREGGSQPKRHHRAMFVVRVKQRKDDGQQRSTQGLPGQPRRSEHSAGTTAAVRGC